MFSKGKKLNSDAVVKVNKVMINLSRSTSLEGRAEVSSSWVIS